MKYGFYLSPCGEHIEYYYFDEEEFNMNTVEGIDFKIGCNVLGWLEHYTECWIYLGE